MRIISPLIILLLASCASGKDQAPHAEYAEEVESAYDRIVMAEPAKKEKSAPAPEPSLSRDKVMDEGLLGGKGDLPVDVPEENQPETRSWFPETFLFEPLLLTEQGTTSVSVRVPDQLSSWRILGLAHSKNGMQTGAETQFLSTMPVYVDLVEPPSLRVGDVAILPVQIVNNQPAPWSGTVKTSVSGDAANGGGVGSISLEPNSGVVRYFEVNAAKYGIATIEAELSGTDKVERSLSVVPYGKKIEASKAGTLGSPREFTLLTPANVNTSTAGITLYPGVLGVLDSEFRNVAKPRDVTSAAYYYWLSGQGKELAQQIGVELKEEDLRAHKLKAYQLLLKNYYNAGVLDKLTMLAAAKSHKDDLIAQDFAVRLLSEIQNEQSPDGTFFTTDAVISLIVCAEAARVSQDDLIKQRSAIYVNRMLKYIDDPGVAAVVIASGLVEKAQTEDLKKLILKNVQTLPDGSKYLKSSKFSNLEATAYAILALKDSENNLVSDLGTWLISQTSDYHFHQVVVFEAIKAIFSDPLPETVKIVVEIDEKQVLVQDLNLASGFSPINLNIPVPTSAGEHKYKVEATPVIPGLIYSVVQNSWIPWKYEEKAGLEARVLVDKTAKVGQKIPVSVIVAAPNNQAFTISIELPAGVDVEEQDLRLLKINKEITNWDVSQGMVEIEGKGLGDIVSFKFHVIPTLSGKFQWGTTDLSVGSYSVFSSPGWLQVALP